jgi:hypothetical protein
VIGFDDGSTAFVKAAVSPQMAARLRAEAHVYRALDASFAPHLLAWDDGEDCSVLILEDLRSAHWPPPWSAKQIHQVLRTLEWVHTTRGPGELPSLEAARSALAGWRRVGADPRPFLRLGLCSADWLERAMPTLLAAEDEAVLAGEDLLHLDVRSDNIAFLGERVVLVDWDSVKRGNGVLDVVAWLPSLHAEGGPAPDEILSNEGALVGLMAGYWAARAGLPAPIEASRVREVQWQQLRVALPWAARALGLPRLDSIRPRSP